MRGADAARIINDTMALNMRKITLLKSVISTFEVD